MNQRNDRLRLVSWKNYSGSSLGNRLLALGWVGEVRLASERPGREATAVVRHGGIVGALDTEEVDRSSKILSTV